VFLKAKFLEIRTLPKKKVYNL